MSRAVYITMSATTDMVRAANLLLQDTVGELIVPDQDGTSIKVSPAGDDRWSITARLDASLIWGLAICLDNLSHHMGDPNSSMHVPCTAFLVAGNGITNMVPTKDWASGEWIAQDWSDFLKLNLQ